MPKKGNTNFREAFPEVVEAAKKIPVRLGDVEQMVTELDELRAWYNRQLVGQIETRDPYADWFKYEHGDTIYETKKLIDDPDWHMTKKGLVVRTDRNYRTGNGGSEPDRKSTFQMFDSRSQSAESLVLPFQGSAHTHHPEGIIYKEDGALILNGKSYAFHDPQRDYEFQYHPWGFIVQMDNEVWLNGNILLTKSLDDGEEFKIHEGGIIVRRNTHPYEYRQNDRRLLASDKMSTRNDLWLATGPGVLTTESVTNGFDYYLNREFLTHRDKCEPMKPHIKGVVFVENGDCDTKLVLNGADTLYEGKLVGFKSYKDGVVVHRKKPSTRSTYEFVFHNGERQ